MRPIYTQLVLLAYFWFSAITLFSFFNVSISTLLFSKRFCNFRHVVETHAHSLFQAAVQVLLAAAAEHCGERVSAKEHRQDKSKKAPSFRCAQTTYPLFIFFYNHHPSQQPVSLQTTDLPRPLVLLQNRTEKTSHNGTPMAFCRRSTLFPLKGYVWLLFYSLHKHNFSLLQCQSVPLSWLYYVWIQTSWQARCRPCSLPKDSEKTIYSSLLGSAAITQPHDKSKASR